MERVLHALRVDFSLQDLRVDGSTAANYRVGMKQDFVNPCSEGCLGRFVVRVPHRQVVMSRGFWREGEDARGIVRIGRKSPWAFKGDNHLLGGMRGLIGGDQKSRRNAQGDNQQGIAKRAAHDVPPKLGVDQATESLKAKLKGSTGPSNDPMTRW